MSKAGKFIEEYTRNCSNEIIGGGWNNEEFVQIFNPWLTPDQARKAVEIVREEMIDKACEYLDGLIELLNDHGHRLKKERIINDLKQAMKDE